MAASDLDWDDLRLFAVLARAGSVRRAARALDVHASTVTRRLEHFERQLDVQLFNRNPGGLRLSPAGEEVLARVERIAAGVADVERAVAGADRRLAGPLRVSLPDALVAVLMPALVAFAHAWPAIRIEFVAAATRPDVGQREADCALTITDAPPQHLIGRSIGRLALAAYGQTALAADAGAAGWVELEGPAELRSDLRQRDFPDAPLVARSPDVCTQLAVLREGMGVGPLPCAIGDVEPGLGRAGGEPMLVGELWLLSHPDLRSTARVRECMKVLTRALRDAQPLLLGRGAR